MIVCIDFDGTITTHDFPRIGKDIGAFSVMKKIQEAGHKIVLFTMRDEKYLDDAVDYIRERGIVLHGVNRTPDQGDWTSSPKAYGHLYIDDRGLGCPMKTDESLSKYPFVDWQRVEEILIEKEII